MVSAIVQFVRASVAEEFFHGSLALDPARASATMLASMLLTVVALTVLSVAILLLLPLQDSLAQGRATTERAATQAVIGRTGALAVSGSVQAAIVFGPPAILFVALATKEMQAVVAEGGTLDTATLVTIQSAVLHGSLAASCWWLAITNLLFLFAAPLLLLEGRGPLRSIWLSATLVFRRGFPEWSRFVAIAFLWAVLYAAVVLPESGLQRMVSSLPRTSFLRTTLPAVWSAPLTAFGLAYGTAGLVILFRRLVPARTWAPLPAKP